MKTLSAIAALALACSPGPAAELPRSAPEAQGVSSAALLAFVQAADKTADSLHGFVMLRHGQKVAECYWAPYDAATRHSMYSLSKSFTSTAAGLAIAEGKLSLDDSVLNAFPEDAPAQPSAFLKAMRVRDLLRMSAGQTSEPKWLKTEPWTKSFLGHPVPYKPGTHFMYNTSATYMVSAMIQKATGQTVLDYLKPRLFEPLGIYNPTWEASPQGVSAGGTGLSIRTGDIAAFGQLYLQKGKWNGRQLVPEAWVAEATARQTSNGSSPTSDWDQGYGYQFWRSRHGAYRGDGAFGQYCIVLPEQDAVIAITAGLGNMQAVLDLVWIHLLPGMKDGPLPSDPEATAKLDGAMKTLALKLPAGDAKPAAGTDRTFAFPSNAAKLESITLAKGGETALVAVVEGTEHRIVCGPGTWHRGAAAWGTFATQPAAAGGAWTAPDTFAAKICFRETPYVVSLNLKFTGDELHLKTQANVGFGANKEVELIGKAK